MPLRTKASSGVSPGPWPDLPIRPLHAGATRSSESPSYSRQRHAWLCVACLLMGLSVAAHTPAQAEERKGLMLGVAIGPSNHFVEATAPTSSGSVIVYDPTTGNTYYIARVSGGTTRLNSGSLSVHLPALAMDRARRD